MPPLQDVQMGGKMKDYGEAPLCACGCGQRVAFSKIKKLGWNKYILGHRSNLPRHFSEDSKKKLSKNRMGQNNPNWKGGEITKPDGRKMTYIGNGRYRYKARVVIEKYLGVTLTSNEVIHHKNKIKHDDSIENLEIISFGEHSTLHNLGRKRSQETIEKHRKLMVGRKASNETKKKMSESLKGRIVSEETRRKIGLANKGKPSSKGMLGKNHTERTKQKISNKLRQFYCEGSDNDK